MLNILAGAVAIGGLLLGQVGYDMAVIQKWEAAKVIRYQVVGVHQARTMVVFGDYEGKADVTDTIAVEFVWDKKDLLVPAPADARVPAATKN